MKDWERMLMLALANDAERWLERFWIAQGCDYDSAQSRIYRKDVRKTEALIRRARKLAGTPS